MARVQSRALSSAASLLSHWGSGSSEVQIGLLCYYSEHIVIHSPCMARLQDIIMEKVKRLRHYMVCSHTIHCDQVTKCSSHSWPTA